MSKKDVIYLDTEDDITSVIDKVKASDAGIIALVPPKRANMLSSVVNLKLLKRGATEENKKVVLITQEKVLSSMAGGIGMFVAKDLKTPPTIPKVSDVDLPSDVISIEGPTKPLESTESATKNSNLAGVAAVKASTEKLPNAVTKKVAKDKKKSDKSTKIPDISKFRKKIFIFGGLAILLIAGLIWALIFAPKATVSLKAATDDIPLETQVTLSTADGAKLDVEAGVIPAERQESKEEINQEYKATGEKNVGNKASGTMTLTRTSVSSNPITVPSGTRFSSGDFVFVSTESAQLDGTTVGPGGIVQDSETVSVVAAEPGEDYNVSARSYQSSNDYDAEGSNMGGGSDEIVKVVAQSDIDGAIDKLEGKEDSEALAELKQKFGDDGLIIIDESFNVDTGEPSASVPAGTEASGGEVTQEVTYSLLAVKTADYKEFIDSTDEAELEDGQKIIDYDEDEVQFASTNGSTYQLTAALQSGPDLDLEELEKELANKSFSEAIEIAESKPGITKADIDLQPFWVFSMPRSAEKITVEIETP